MHKDLFMRRGGEGVALWVKIIAIFGAIALSLSALTIAPTSAYADDTDTVSTSTEDSDTANLDTTDPVESTVTEPESEPETESGSFAEDLAEALTPFSTPETRAGPGYNSDIKVDIKPITAQDPENTEGLTVGDTVVVEGSWDATALDGEALDTVFWVSFPEVLTDLQIVAPATGATLLRDANGQVYGLKVDTAYADWAGTWKVEATVAAATDDGQLNFRTSQNSETDVSVDLPGEGGIKAQVQARSQSAASSPHLTTKITEIVWEGGADTQLDVGDSVQVKGEWTASPDVQAGETFSITVPEVFAAQAIPPFSLKGDNDADYGECVLTGNVLTCTVSETAQIKDDVHGGWELWIEASQRTTEKEVTFDIDGGEDYVWQLPGENGGIGKLKPLPTDMKKTGSKSGQQTFNWTVELPGSALLDADVPVPGIFTDTPTGGHQVVENSAKLQYYSEFNASGNPVLIDIVDGVAITTTEGDDAFTLAVTPDGQAWDPDKVYRITYQTKSDELQDPTAEITNEIRIGENGEGIKPSNPLKPTWKSGKPVADTNYNTLEWTILVPHRIADNQGKVTITDTLAGLHQFTDASPGTLNVSGGVTSAALEVNAADKATITFTVPEGDPENTVYTVKYRTFYKGDSDYPQGSLPKHGQDFTNSATLGEFTVEGKVTTPAWGSSKAGSLNAKEVTVAGETRPINSTLNWTIGVSGNRIAGLDAPITVTDKLSGPHQVCGTGDNALERLNASLKVISLVGNKEISDHGAVLSAEVVGDQEITFTITGELSRDYRYDIVYTTCTESGGMDEFGTKYGNAVEGTGIKTSREVELRAGGSGWGTGVDRGSFSLKKGWQQGSASFADNLVFKVQVEEFAPGKDPDNPADRNGSPYIIEVTSDGTPVSGWASRGDGWTIKLTEVVAETPNIEGHHWGTPQFSGGENVRVSEDRTIAYVTTTGGANVDVSLNNKLLKSEGTVSIEKKIEGSAAGEVPALTPFTVKVKNGSQITEHVVYVDEETNIGTFPIGTELSFTEVQPENTDTITWGSPVFNPSTVKIKEADQNVKVTLTNTAEVTEGTFNLRKQINCDCEPADHPAVPETFKVIASWTIDGETHTKDLFVDRQGNITEFGENLPAGTLVTLEEEVPAAGNGIKWGAPVFSGTGVTMVDGKGQFKIGLNPVEITVKNTYVPNDGKLRLTKEITGDAEGAVGEDVNFQIEARWQKQGDLDYTTEILTIQEGEFLELGPIQVGTQVTFRELTPLPEIEGVEWGAPQWLGESDWLTVNGETATVIVSDDPTEGRLVTLTNTANWKLGELQINKKIVEDGEVVEVKDSSLDDSAEFTVRITSIEPPLADDVNFPQVGQNIALNKSNNWSWSSGKVLPKGTKVTFTEVDPNAGPGYDWAKPLYVLGTDGEDGLIYGATVEITGEDKTDTVEIHNRLIPTTEVVIDKSVTGPKGNEVENDSSSTFQVTAEWTDADEQDRQCIINVKPNGTAVPTTSCDATVIDGKIYFPKNSEITFTETGATTDVSNVKWGEVIWSIIGGDADINENGEKSATVTITGDEGVTLGLENKTSSNGLIIIPIPIPIPEWPGFPGSSTPPGPGEPGTPTEPGQPTEPGTPTEPGKPTEPTKPSHPGKPGHPVSPEKQAEHAQAVKGKGGGLAVTGANVAWLAGGALALILAGAWLTLRRRNKES